MSAPPQFDVFLSHNKKDIKRVRQLGKALKERGLTVWLDDWELVPGRPWQPALEQIISTAKSAAVLVGKDGLGPWEDPEMRACLSQFVQRTLPVIPVLLPGASQAPVLPLFLQAFTWVDLRGGFSDEGFDRVQWGVTGMKPAVRLACDKTTTPKSTPIPLPPEFYKVPAYTLTNAFVGRRAELAQLDNWARSGDSVMVVEAIGGMGKSALTWEWTCQHATEQIAGLQGRLWWSFYERGTSVKTFVRHALAYVTRQDPETLKQLNAHDCVQRLLVELRRSPYLLVLDGFERVLTAYHRENKAQMRDEAVPTDHRECTNPTDGATLRQLVQCAPSKLLVTSRLMPTALEDRHTHQPLPGVLHLGLAGLAPADALELVRHAGVRGDRTAILQFANDLGRHALVLRIVCGMVTFYPPHPGDFDAWHADPHAGGALKLSELPIKQRYTHVLEYAFRGMDEKTRQLLSRIAVLSDSADYATIAVLNPFLPQPPEPVPEPENPFDTYEWRRFERQVSGAMSPEKREEITAKREAYRAQHEPVYREKMQAYQNYQAALSAHYNSVAYHQAIADFHAALGDLQARGLLQWDRIENAYDLHPVVRAYAFEQLEERDRTQTYCTISNHFSSLPPENVDEATELAHVKNSLEIMRALIGADRLGEAASFYRGTLSNRLYFSIGAYATVIELIRPLLARDTAGLPVISDLSNRSYLMNDVALALGDIGRTHEAIELQVAAVILDLESGDWPELAIRLLNLSSAVAASNRRALSHRVLELTFELAAADGDDERLTTAIAQKMGAVTQLGEFEDATSLLAEFRKHNQPTFVIYQPGEVEYWVALARFWQGMLSVVDLDQADQVAGSAAGLRHQERMAALRAEWELMRGNPSEALEAIERALSIARRTGSPAPAYLAIRATALARLGLLGEARETMADAEETWNGRLPQFARLAAEACLALGDRARACGFVRKAYPLAWADGPPYIHWYELKRCRELMAELGEPEPVLPPFDPAKVETFPFEADIRAVIAKLHAERAAKEAETDGDGDK